MDRLLPTTSWPNLQVLRIYASYVWESGTTHPGGHLPRAIKDAFEVTISLGYRYLRVDRYCVKQDIVDKHHQIRQMDLVYRTANVTIVAAEGVDADSGLPGVYPTCRREQLTADLGGHTMLFAAEHPQTTISKNI